jgi:hypothetical protein
MLMELSLCPNTLVASKPSVVSSAATSTFPKMRGAGPKDKNSVKFVVTKDGNLSAVEFLVQPDERFKREILRVMSKMPKWKPGSQHGKTVMFIIQFQ